MADATREGHLAWIAPHPDRPVAIGAGEAGDRALDITRAHFLGHGNTSWCGRSIFGGDASPDSGDNQIRELGGGGDAIWGRGAKRAPRHRWEEGNPPPL